MVIVKCAQCEKEFKVKPYRIKRSKNLFCSKECKNKWQSENNREKNSPLFNSVKLTCKNCGKEFYRKPSQVKNVKNHFCSIECKQKYIKLDLFKVSCQNCGKEIELSKYRISRSKYNYCSRQCQNEYQARNKPKNLVKCEYCGKEFHKKPSQVKKSKHHYCSKYCLNKDKKRITPKGKDNPRYNSKKLKCDHCGKEIIRSPANINNTNFCSIACMAKWKSEHQIGENNPNHGNNKVSGENNGRWLGGWDRIRKLYKFYGYTFEKESQERQYRHSFSTHIKEQENLDTTKYETHHLLPVKAFPYLMFEEFNGIPMGKKLHRKFHNEHGGPHLASKPYIDWIDKLVEFLDKEINQKEGE